MRKIFAREVFVFCSCDLNIHVENVFVQEELDAQLAYELLIYHAYGEYRDRVCSNDDDSENSCEFVMDW